MLLTIVIEVPDDIDHTDTDPHDVAEDVIHIANEAYEANGDPRVTFRAAEWGLRLPDILA